MFPKHVYVRDKALLKRVAQLDCQHCGSGEMVQAAQKRLSKNFLPMSEFR
jgi:hypothetical protein